MLTRPRRRGRSSSASTRRPPRSTPQQLLAQLGTGAAEKSIASRTSWPGSRHRRAPSTIPSQAAFQVWSQTSLSRSRVTSEIELFGADRSELVSRFALNLPEYPVRRRLDVRGPARTAGGTSSAKSRASAPRTARSSRPSAGVCDADGQFLGAIVVHVAPDYPGAAVRRLGQPLSTTSSPRRRPGAAHGVAPELTCRSSSTAGACSRCSRSAAVAWPISREISTIASTGSRDAVLDRLESRRATTVPRPLQQRSRRASTRSGYPAPTVVRARRCGWPKSPRCCRVHLRAAAHRRGGVRAASRGAATRRCGLLFDEIRTSFYRKLFLFFVLAADRAGAAVRARVRRLHDGRSCAPTSKSEAASVVTVARRVFEELAAADSQPGQHGSPPTDDVMVWIRQVIDQDVNLFDGPQLVATSQRDLFDSGLLPTRTPAAVYRAIALDRLPIVVDEDRARRVPVPGGRRAGAGARPRRRAQRAAGAAPARDRTRDRRAQPRRARRRGPRRAVCRRPRARRSPAASPIPSRGSRARRGRSPRAGSTCALVADTADELGRLVDDFNSMAATLVAQRGELARTNQLKAWAEMARQVAHEIKNPLTPIQLAAEHLQRVHEDQGRPLGAVVRSVRRDDPRPGAAAAADRVGVLELRRRADAATGAGRRRRAARRRSSTPYRLGLRERDRGSRSTCRPTLPAVRADRTLLARALTNLVENAVQAMPAGGTLTVGRRRVAARRGRARVADTGVGMDAGRASTRAFEPYFSTKTGGSGLGLANAKRNIELSGGTIAIASAPGARARR